MNDDINASKIDMFMQTTTCLDKAQLKSSSNVRIICEQISFNLEILEGLLKVTQWHESNMMCISMYIYTCTAMLKKTKKTDSRTKMQLKRKMHVES